MSEIVALLLDDAMPAERLGTLLRAARKRRGWKRKQAAAAARTTPALLRAYEQGSQPVPPDVCTRLAECYGTDLSAHIPMRVPPQVNHDWLVVEEHRLPRVTGTTDEVVKDYAQIVARLRGVKAGDALPLRAADLAVLGSALEADPDDIGSRIAAILQCSVEEARTLHREMLRRKVVIPAAGLAAGAMALIGVNAAYASSSSHSTPAPPPASVTTVAPTPHTHVTLAPTTTTRPTTAAPTPAPKPAPVQQHETDATVPPDQQPADTPTTVASPPTTAAPTDDGTVSTLPGETPVEIIGTSITSIAHTPPDHTP
jgi:transcriptional regulator with XRE-family HTH domain